MPVICSDVIIVGGGVSGLAAAAALAKRGLNVVILEARARLGGRVFTTHPKGWGRPIELGAEFIHGGNPDLWRICRRHRLRTQRLPSRHWLYREGGLKRLNDIEAQIENVTKQIDARHMRSWTFAEFLRWEKLRISNDERNLAAGLIEGFEAAPLEEMSAAAMAGETLEDDKQFFLPLGYHGLVTAILAELPPQRVRIFRNTVVTSIHWRRGNVTARSPGRVHQAKMAIVSLPLGVLQAKPSLRGAVRFAPPLRQKNRILAKMRMGQVVRLVVRFEARKWKRLVASRPGSMPATRFGFIHSRIEGVPVWWSLRNDSVITGWAGGPSAIALGTCSKSEIREKALGSLTQMFGVTKSQLKGAMRGCEIHDWSHDPFSRGAYSFASAGAPDGSERLRLPMRETLFFAGEATAEGSEIGTVHGALASGIRAAKEVGAAWRRGS